MLRDLSKFKLDLINGDFSGRYKLLVETGVIIKNDGQFTVPTSINMLSDINNVIKVLKYADKIDDEELVDIINSWVSLGFLKNKKHCELCLKM